jgi:carbon-monoxide dehydrogenase iron sulfur subunit
VEACIAGAMKKNEDGEVECDQDKCINCGMCVMVCSFGAVKPGKTGVFKCDMCPDTDAACVTACPTGALFAATPEEYEKIMQEKRKTGTKA